MDGLIYVKPLSLADRVLIDTVTHRFEGVEAPFVAFDRGDHWELKCAPTIRMTPERLAHLKGQQGTNAIALADKAQEVLRLSNGAGASNGLPSHGGN